MASRGNPTLQVRVSPLFISQIDARIAQRNEHTREEPWTRSDFVFAAILEKLDHMKRSNERKKRKKTPVSKGEKE